MESNLDIGDKNIIDSGLDKDDMNKRQNLSEKKKDSISGLTEEEESEEKEGKSSDENNNKKRDRDEDEGNSPTKKRVRNSPSKRNIRKSKIEKGKNYNKKYKKARKCKDCEGCDEEKCILCCKNEHVCETEVNRERKKGRVWIWICKECSEIMGDEGVIEEMKEIVKREKDRKIDKKDEKIDCCRLCDEVINRRHISVECTQCKEWVHLKCSKFET